MKHLKTSNLWFISLFMILMTSQPIFAQSGMIDVNQIIIPFDQKIAVTFIGESMGFRETRFGWMFATDVEESGEPDVTKIRWVYQEINDNDLNGVLDLDGRNKEDRYGDRNQDGEINVRDNREILVDENSEEIIFVAGTELVFVLDSSLNTPGTCNWCGGIFYTKQEWNEPQLQCGGLSRILNLYLPDLVEPGTPGDISCYEYNSECTAQNKECHQQPWLCNYSLDLLELHYGYFFHEPSIDDPADLNLGLLSVPMGDPSIHAVMAVPNGGPYARILGLEDTKLDDTSYTDFDYNDVMILIETIDPGDYNADGTVDLFDAIIVLKTLSGIPDSGFHSSGLDAVRDGKISMEDAVYILGKAGGFR